MKANGTKPQSVQITPGMHAGPIPTTAVSTTALDQYGNKLVCLRLETPQGMSLFFLPPDQAEQLGKQLRQQSVQAKLGLQVARDLPAAKG